MKVRKLTTLGELQSLDFSLVEKNSKQQSNMRPCSILSGELAASGLVLAHYRPATGQFQAHVGLT